MGKVAYVIHVFIIYIHRQLKSLGYSVILACEARNIILKTKRQGADSYIWLEWSPEKEDFKTFWLK